MKKNTVTKLNSLTHSLTKLTNNPQVPAWENNTSAASPHTIVPLTGTSPRNVPSPHTLSPRPPVVY